MQSPREAQIERVLAEMEAEAEGGFLLDLPDLEFRPPGGQVDLSGPTLTNGQPPVVAPPHLPLKQVTDFSSGESRASSIDYSSVSDGVYWSPQRRTISDRQQHRSLWR